MNKELQIVIPVYNEQASLPALIDDWRSLFRHIPVDARFLFVDDGSTDDSLAMLRTFQQTSPDIDIHSQPNAGHGPAILAGYKLALQAEWVLQVDSDHQLAPSAFTQLWHRRKQYDLLLGQRSEKNATYARRFVSAISYGIVCLLYGRGVKDVNSPFRLFRSSRLAEVLPHIPEQSFAPNVLLTAWFITKRMPILTLPVSLRSGIPLRKSRMNGYFLKGSLQALFQTILFRFHL